MKLLAFTGALLLAFTFAALAQVAPATTVTIPVGDWAASLLMTVSAILLPVITWALRWLPASVQSIIRTAQVEQLLAKAIDYGINATADAAKGKVLTVDVGNKVLAEAVDYAIVNGPGWLSGWLGGEAGIRDRIIARLPLAPEAAIK